MTDFIDSCIVIAYFNPHDSNHEITKKFIQSRTEDILITWKTYLEITSTIRKKINQALIEVFKKFHKKKFTTDMDRNLKKIKSGFMHLKRKYPELENFYSYLEDKAFEFLKRGSPDIYILADWATEIDIETKATIEEIIGSFSVKELPSIIGEEKRERKKDIKKCVASINFKDEFDETIFYEIAVNAVKYRKIRFFTVDNKFSKIGNNATNLLVEEGLLEDKQLIFYDVNKL